MSQNIQRYCLKYSPFLFFLLFFQGGFEQRDFKKIDMLLQERQSLMGKDIVALIWKDTLVYKKELGDLKSRTQAPIASASKWLTAALIMSFVDEGKLSLDDKVSKFLPIYAKYGKSYITIRHCLSHMTGIQSEPIRIVKLLERKKFKSLEEEVDEFAKKEIQSNPGLEFYYNNMGLNIAGRVLEVVSKKKFDQLIQQRLFRPLGMRYTTFSNFESSINPSGGAKSTADDYMKFLVMLLNKGMSNGQRILTEESVKQLTLVQTKPQQVKYAPRAATGYGYASGAWVMEQDKNGYATVLSSPGLFGTWPMIDFCRGYAYLFFVKNLLGEERAETHLEVKKLIDEQIPSTCR